MKLKMVIELTKIKLWKITIGKTVITLII